MSHLLIERKEYRTDQGKLRINARCSRCGKEFDFDPDNTKRLDSDSCPSTTEWAVLAIRVPEEYKARVEAFSLKNNFPSMSNFVRGVLTEHMEANGG